MTSDLLSPCCDAISASGEEFLEGDTYNCSACGKALVVAINDRIEVHDGLSLAYLVEDKDEAE